MSKLSYYLGDKALSGFARQRLDENGELCYKGVIHLFGNKVPIYISLEPHDKFVKGEKVYKVFTYLTPIPTIPNKKMYNISLRLVNSRRLAAIRKVEETVKKLGVIYEYYERTKEEKDRERCNRCKTKIRRYYEQRIQEASRRTYERQKEIRVRQVQKLLARRKGNKRNGN